MNKTILILILLVIDAGCITKIKKEKSDDTEFVLEDGTYVEKLDSTNSSINIYNCDNSINPHRNWLLTDIRRHRFV